MTAKNGKPCPKCGNNEWNNSGDCAPCARARVARWQKENVEKKRYNSRTWWQRHPEKSANRGPNKRTVPGIAAERQRTADWKRANPDKVNAVNQRRRCAKKGNGGSFTAQEWNDLCERYGHRCLCCGKTGVKLTVDHVVPIIKGGSNNIDNIQPLCQTCNLEKFTKIIDYRPID